MGVSGSCCSSECATGPFERVSCERVWLMPHSDRLFVVCDTQKAGVSPCVDVVLSRANAKHSLLPSSCSLV